MSVAQIGFAKLEVRAGIRETTFDHSLMGRCGCDGTNCPPQWRTYEHVPLLDQYLINDQEVSLEEFRAKAQELGVPLAEVKA